MPRSGFVVLHRKMLDWEWFQKPNMVTLWIYLLLMAQHAPTKWQGISIEAGQLVTSLDRIVADTGITKRSLRTCLERLKSTHEITVKSTHQYSLITIDNWALYQDHEEKPTHESTHESTHDRHTTDTRPTLCNNVNNDNNIFTASQEVDLFGNQVVELEQVKAKKRAKPKAITPTKETYGSQNNVALTKEEYDRLKADYPYEAEDAIEFLSLYIPEKGYKSASHNLAIRRWVIDAVKERNAKAKQPAKSGGTNGQYKCVDK